MEGENKKREIQDLEDKGEQQFSVRQSENTFEQNGLVSVEYSVSWSEVRFTTEEDCEEIGGEEEVHEWYEAGSELKERLEDLRENAEGHSWEFSDCKVSLAEYSKPELDEKNISGIKTCFLFVRENENFYYGTLEEAREALLAHCRRTGIPTPNEIQYVINGYYIKWKFKEGFSRSEILLWKFIQKFLHGVFADLGSISKICEDATVMLYVSGFAHSNYVDFDLCDKTTTIYNDDGIYDLPSTFASKLPLNFSEITEYRKVNENCEKLARRLQSSGTRTNNQPVESSVELELTERATTWIDTIADALRDENCTGEQYRYYQYRDTAKPKKFYKWLAINQNKGVLPRFNEESDSWISAATYYSRFRRKGNIAAINCNFLIIKWEKSVLEFTPTPEQGKELVLSRCRELGLPEPYITATPDGLEVKWYWNDRMTKILYEHDLFNAKFNEDWDKIQRSLYRKFWYLGADPKKLCVTVMFAIPGSKDTRKSLKVNDNARIIREIHKGEVVESYRDIQRILGLKETYCGEIAEVVDEVTQQKWEMFSRDNFELVKDWQADILRIHPSSKNWVCFGFIDENHKWNNRWTQANKIQEFLMKLVYKPEFSACDFYVSQGEFFSRNDRTVDNLTTINASFVDLDYKILVKYRPEITENPTPEAWEELVKAHCEKLGIPLPNDVVFSGGGVHLKWIYDEAASRAELPLWQYSQNLLLSQFKTLGADPNSADAARVLRLVGTENHKDSPIIQERLVHVIDREFFSGTKIELRELVKGLEASQPENLEEFNAAKSEWQRTLAQLSIREANMLRPDTDRITDYKSEDYIQADNYWLENTLRHHKLHPTYLAAEISGVTKWIETYQLHGSLKSLYGTPNIKLSLSELKEQERLEKREAIEWIPCNYVVLSRCPGRTFEEQKANILRRCDEYREIGIPQANQIITIGDTLLVEWTYQSVLTGLALSRWQLTQEFLCRYFEDWGAMDKPEYLKATALLPVPGFVYDGVTARLEYSDLLNRYTFNRLAKAVLNFSQKEVEEYKKQKAAEKAKHAPARKIALPENVNEKVRKAQKTAEGKSQYVDFQIMAMMRYMDIIKFLELQKLENGEIPQNTRELCCFWALVFAKQAGLITTYEEFKAKAEELIRFCGLQFSTECTVKTLESAFTKHYSATTDTLIKRLQITPEYQKHMKVLLIGVRVTSKKRPQQTREEYLATHDQERRKLWELYGFSRRTYFRRKAAGTLPPLPMQLQISVPVLPEKTIQGSGTSCLYIMSATPILSFILRCYDEWEFRREGLRAFLGASSLSARLLEVLCLGILYHHSHHFLQHNSSMFLKRRRKGKRKRKRKKG